MSSLRADGYLKGKGTRHRVDSGDSRESGDTLGKYFGYFGYFGYFWVSIEISEIMRKIWIFYYG